MHTELRITVFEAALATPFGTAYGLGGTADAISPEPKNRAHGAHVGPESTPGGARRTMAVMKLRHPGAYRSPRAATPSTCGLRGWKPVRRRSRATPSYRTGPDRTGRKVTAYQREHGKELHPILASRDLTVYRCLHPARAADGTWSTPVELPKAGSYRAFADFKPQGGPCTCGACRSAAPAPRAREGRYAS